MKRIGRILFCLLPLFITFVLQNLISIPLCGVSALTIVLQNYRSGIPLMELYEKIVAFWSTSDFLIALSASYAVAALFLFGFWYWKKYANTQELISAKNAFNPWIVASLALLAVGLQYVTTYLTTFVGIMRPDWMRAYESLAEMAGFDSASPLLVAYSCLIAPISEELIFRGVTLGCAKKAMPAAAAVCLQAVLFGIFHMNIIQGIYAAFLGLFLGYLCEEGGSITIPILLHAFFNFSGTFLSRYLYFHIEQPFFFLLWLTVGVLLTYTGIFLFQHGVMVRDLPKEFAKSHASRLNSKASE